MPLAHAVFFAEPREFTEEQIRELDEAGLLHKDQPAAAAPAPPPAPRPPADKESK